jgi:cytoskeletal protein CcmA (bactofilin family)
VEWIAECYDVEGGAGMSVIEHGVVVSGDIFGEVSLILKGAVTGSIFLQNADLTIEETGYVEGEVRAEKIIVSGEVLGNVTAESLLELTPTAKIRGNIRTAKLSMAEQAIFSGGLTIQEPEPVELEIRDFKSMSEDDYAKLRRWRMRYNIE